MSSNLGPYLCVRSRSRSCLTSTPITMCSRLGHNAHTLLNLPVLHLPDFRPFPIVYCLLSQYEESLLEMRRVLHACILHAPSNVDAFWAAAAVEGGVSPDSRDMSESSTEAGSEGASGRGQLALSEELVRVLGLADLDLREEDLPLLGDM